MARLLLSSIYSSIYSSVYRSFLLAVLVFCFQPLAQARDEQVQIQLDTLSRTITAGEQVELALTIRYDEAVEIVFDPEAQEWGDMELLSAQVAPLYWIDGYWQYTVYMDATFLLPGQYDVPVFAVDVFKGSAHWQLRTEPQSIDVHSAFDDAPFDVQSTLTLGSSGQEESGYPKSYFFYLLFILSGLIAIVLIRRRKAVLPFTDKALSAVDIAEHARVTDAPDWEALRQWLMTQTGADPTGQLTANEPLLHRYQQLRFKAGNTTGNTTGDFIKYCHDCQERWG